MIIDALISLPVAVLTAIISLLPDYTGLPSGMSSALDYVLNFTLQVGDILPTQTIWAVILATLTLEVAIMAFNSLAWLFHWKQPKS